ncbi:hypothetical protein F5Y08DRAFT_302572 [Xylaria arbuscula]|nr:hypothetical protein F5Y08DRAFT_302572 [Xylaria arbuscula]
MRSFCAVQASNCCKVQRGYAAATHNPDPWLCMMIDSPRQQRMIRRLTSLNSVAYRRTFASETMGTVMEEGVRPCQMSLSSNTKEHDKSDQIDQSRHKVGGKTAVCLTSYEVDADSHSRRSRIFAVPSPGFRTALLGRTPSSYAWFRFGNMSPTGLALVSLLLLLVAASPRSE